MATREERARLRQEHAKKIAAMPEQPQNHAMFDKEVPSAKLSDVPEVVPVEDERIEKETLPSEKTEKESSKPLKAEDTPVEKKASKAKAEPAVTEKKSKKAAPEKKAASDKPVKAVSSKGTKESAAEEKEALMTKYVGARAPVKAIGKEEDIRFWIKQSRKTGIPQQDYLGMIFCKAMEHVKDNNITDDSEEVLPYQKALHDMAAPVNAHIPNDLLADVKDVAADLCLRQSGFCAYALHLARIEGSK